MGNHPSKERPDHYSSPSDRRPAPVSVGSHGHRISAATSPTSPTHPPGINDGLGTSNNNTNNPASPLQPPPGYRQSPSTTNSSSSNLRDRSNRRPSRHDMSLFGLAVNHHGGYRPDLDPSSPDARKETKAEREARKLAKEREARNIERERSIREESVDGGFLVTLGVYTGTEDFSKPIVRQLMLERRLAPFWKGLNDLDTDLKDNQIVAVVQGLPVPPPEENSNPVCPENETIGLSQTLNLAVTPSDTPIPSPSHSAFPPSPTNASFQTTPISPSSSVSTSSAMLPPFFRGRAKTFASTISSSFSRNNSQSDFLHSSLSLSGMPPPPEIRLNEDPTTINDRAIEAVLYSQAIDCPICFLSYPPYLNKTRCCDQPICSECFVQIKRPDPHHPENHGDEPGTPSEPTPPISEDYNLISEPATCPYCKMPEFGITYEPPPFRRGLAYAPIHSPTYYGSSIGGHSNMHHLHKSAMSSSSSISSSVNSSALPHGDASVATPIGGSSTPTGSTATRHRRNQSVSADAPNVITTDKIRPDWAKKLADMRAHALRRAAAATALHNAAYMLGNLEAQGYQRGESSRGVAVFRRRRGLFFGGSGQASPIDEPHRQMSDDSLSGNRSVSAGDIFPGRVSSLASGPPGPPGAPVQPVSRRSRMEDLEELMMMEAIRQSIAAEEERKRKEEAEKEKKKEGDSSTTAKETSATPTPLSTARVMPSTLPHLSTSVPTHTAHPLSVSMSMPRSPTTSESGDSSISEVPAAQTTSRGLANHPETIEEPLVPQITVMEPGKGIQAQPAVVAAEASNTDSAPKVRANESSGVIEGIEHDADKKTKSKGKESVLNVNR